ncbi:MAG: HAMP domain-containing sensor histidine kinase [Chloroflexota bacterium]
MSDEELAASTEKQHEHPWEYSGWEGKRWDRHRRFRRRWSKPSPILFLRFLMFFGFMAVLVLGGMAAVAFLLTRLLNGPGHTAVLVWVAGCSMSLAFPLLAMRLGMGAFRRIARPLGNVMTAADAVAEGDFTVRVPEQSGGEFKKLAQSFNRMAEQLELSDEQRRNLTADVAHELRNPLHIIQGNLEGILDGVYEPTAEHIQDTLEETQLLARLVEDLRTLSLAESGHLPLFKADLDVNALLADLETSFAGQAESLGITLTFKGTKRPFLIHGDADRLNQALSNIMINAIRHTPGGGSIEVIASAGETHVQIAVKDTGEGISEEALPFLFDRFWKGDKSRTGAGTGLGLAITRQLIVAHDGKIDVKSTLGEGATFTIQLPIATPQIPSTDE